jgi:hypothetical protein
VLGSARLLVVACVPAFNEEGSVGSVVVRAMRFAGRVVACVDRLRDLTGAIAKRVGAVLVPSVKIGGIILKNVDLKASMWASWRSMWR